MKQVYRQIRVKNHCMVRVATLFTSLLMCTVLGASNVDNPADLTMKSGNEMVQFSGDGISVAAGSELLSVRFDGANEVQPTRASSNEVTYPNLWDDVRLVYDQQSGALARSTYYLGEATGVVDASRIRLTYSQPVNIDEQTGCLTIALRNGTLQETAPVAWQEVSGTRTMVDVAFKKLGNNQVGFVLGHYQEGIPVVIDPTMTWHTFVGSSTGTDVVNDICTDAAGNIYVCGYSTATWGSPISSHKGYQEPFAAKYDSNGNLMWNTFLGTNSDGEMATGIAVDYQGNVYVCGHRMILPTDAFVAKLGSSGALTSSLNFGGTGNDYAKDIQVSGHTVFITGYSTTSWGNPLNTYTGLEDMFLFCLDNNLIAEWLTFGGAQTSYDQGSALAIGANDDIYVVGKSSRTWGTPIDIYKGADDGFVARYRYDGSRVWNTFVGAMNDDDLYDIKISADGNIVACGFSMATWGSPVNAFSGYDDGFAVKLSNMGQRMWNTFMGVDNKTDKCNKLVIDSRNNIYCTGFSSASWGNIAKPYTGSADAFVQKLTPAGQRSWTSFYGGSGSEESNAIGIISNTQIVIAGKTSSNWVGLTPVSAYKGGTDGFIAKIANIPVAGTNVADNISDVSARFNWRIDDVEYNNPTSHGVCYATVTNPTIANSKVELGSTSILGVYNATANNLVANTLYYYRAFTSNADGVFYGTQASFTTKRAVTITWPTPASIVYGTELSAIQLNASASVAGTYSYSPASGTILTPGAQSLTVTFTPTDLVQYSVTTKTITINVTNKPLTIKASNAGKEYGNTKTFLGYEITVSGLVGSDAVTSATLTSAGGDPAAPVNSYAITPSAAVGKNLNYYTITYVNGILSVTKAPLTIKPNIHTKVYGTVLNPSTSNLTATGLKNQDNVSSVTIASSGGAAIAPIGTYYITPSAAVGSGLTNYTITYVENILTVTKAPLSITAKDQTKTYGEWTTLPATEFTAVGLVNGDVVTSATMQTAALPASAAPGLYEIAVLNAEGSKINNYEMRFYSGTYRVTNAKLTITANSTTKEYGEVKSLTNKDFTTSSLFNSDVVTSCTILSTGLTAASAVGEYPITISSAMGTNLDYYDITYVNGTLKVTAAPLTIKANDQSKTYGASSSISSSQFTATGLKNGQKITSATITSVATAPTAAATTHPIDISAAIGTNLANYAVTYQQGTYTVNKAALSINAISKSKVYGTTFVFSNDFTPVGLLNNDEVSSVSLSSVGAVESAPVGNYSILCSDAVGIGLDNYNIIYVESILNVSKAPLSIKAKNITKTYGDLYTPHGTEFEVSGLTNNDGVSSVSFVSGGFAALSKVGSYAITPSAAKGVGLTNYTITYVDGQLLIDKAQVIITASAKSKIYGTALQLNQYTDITSVGLRNNEKVHVSFDCSGLIATAGVGQYDITPNSALGLDYNNYTVSYAKGTLTVNKATLTVKAQQKDVFWGDEMPVLTPIYYGFVNNETETVLDEKPSLATTATMESVPGSYPITVTGGNDDNYTFSYSDGTLYIIAIPSIRLSKTFQGKTLSTLSQVITCGFSQFADMYVWSFTDSLGVVTHDSSATIEIIPGKSALKFSSKYMVSVKVKNGIRYSEVSQVDSFFTPAFPLTRLGAQFHNMKMRTMQDTIVAIKVEGATLYLYQFIDEKTGARFRHYNKGNSLRVGDVPGMQLGHSYQVTVLPRFYNSLSQFSVGARIFTPVK